MEPIRVWCRMTVLGADGRALVTDVLEGVGAPDLGTVDAVAHRALATIRAGGRLVLRDVDPDLEDLLRLAGLPLEVVPRPR